VTRLDLHRPEKAGWRPRPFEGLRQRRGRSTMDCENRSGRSCGFGDPTFGTHYCVLAHILQFDDRPTIKVDDQHSEVAWLRSPDPGIHRYSQVYFDLLGTRPA
jgi:hypothetical protein